jgi:uncharacterized protein (TIGR02646 family)
MRKISKSNEPLELSKWKRANPKLHRYDDLDKNPEGKAARQKINEQNIKDQFGLCAYCCKGIDENDSMNEHLIPRDKDHSKELDFSNIVASCTTKKQCDNAHKNQDLPLTPLMDECETELQFFTSGEVKGQTERAITTIEVLQLNHQKLIDTRKQIIDAVIFDPPGFRLNELEDEELLSIVESSELENIMADLKQPKAGLLEEFSPVLVNVLQQYLKK